MPDPSATFAKPLLLYVSPHGEGVGLFEALAGPLDGSQILSFIWDYQTMASMALSREMRTGMAAVLVQDLRRSVPAVAAIKAMPDYPEEGDPA